ncbi:MAG: 7TM diverse intracellular signaling domain-containing protein [Agriterribacter sp.]
MFRKLTIAFLYSFTGIFVYAQNSDFIDIGKIQHYDTVPKRLSYFIDYAEKFTIDDVPVSMFAHPLTKSPFDQNRLEANYYIKFSVFNSGITDSFLFYAGKAQRYNMYEADSAGKKVLLNNYIEKFSPELFNKVPYSVIHIAPGQYKTFYIEARINFYNWYLFDPVIVQGTEHAFFSFHHILQPSRLYITVTIFMLGIMFSMFAYICGLVIREPLLEYFYYMGAIFVFMLYFGLRLLNVYYFGQLYYSFYDLRYQGLQLLGHMLILSFMVSFLKAKQRLPLFYRQVQLLIYLQIIFLVVNLPLTYTNKYNYAANTAFDVMRVFALLYSTYLAIYLMIKKKKKESRYLAIGSLLSISIACLALYVDRWSSYDELLLRYSGISVLIFMTGVMLQMILFLMGLGYRRRMQEAERVRAVEQLQLENDRKELDKYKAIIDARDNERTRISQEIHDDIGSGLTSIRLLSEIAKVKINQPNNKELEKISTTSNVLMDKMNEIIWTLNSGNDTLPNLVAYLRHQIVEYFEPLPFSLRLTIPESIGNAAVSAKVRRNVMLSVKEALHNIVKHSQASEVSVEFSVDHFFSISIKDNGVGFNSNEVHIYNNGLRNMKERLNVIGGSCIVLNNDGTLIILNVPLV